jgi:hypothetical protein
VSAFIDERRCDFGVELICHTLGVSASSYYERATGQRSARAVEDERLLEVIKKTHAANYEAYGSRRMWKQLRRQGETAPRCRVERLMAANDIVGAKRPGRPWRTTVQGAEPVSSEFAGQREGERPEHQDVLVLQRREPGEVLVVDFAAVAAEVADGVVHVLGVPEHEDVERESECGEQVFLAFAVGLA